MPAHAQRRAWQLVEPGKPLQPVEDTAAAPGPGEVRIDVAGCGLCHTDITFLSGQVTPRAGLPIVLGHEIAGTVAEAGAGAEAWLHAQVVVPAVIPCGDCAFCRQGRGNICGRQCMPGNDRDGGFASTVTLPAQGLARVDTLPEGHTLADFSVIADAVSTALHAVTRAHVGPEDLVIVVGAGGIGGYTAQICAARGAKVVAVDVKQDRLDLLREHGAMAAINGTGLDPRALRDQVRKLVKEGGLPRAGWKIFECSGTVPGQQSAYGLLGTAATLAVVGYTREPTSVRLSNLMAFDATAFGIWGCPPELYPEAIDLVSSGRIALKPFVRHVPMAEIAAAIESSESGEDPRRAVLIP